MGILDDSDSESSDGGGDYGSGSDSGSEAGVDVVGDLPSSAASKKSKAKGGKNKKVGGQSSVLEGDNEHRLQTLLNIKDDLGYTEIDAQETREKEAHKNALKSSLTEQKETEAAAIEGMTEDEGIQYRKDRAFSMMNKIRIKHVDTAEERAQQIQQQQFLSGYEEPKHDDGTGLELDREQDAREQEEYQRLKQLKEQKKKKRGARSKSPIRKTTTNSRGARTTASKSKSPLRKTKSVA